MKIDRRCFLSLVIGGAAGTALTPLPWKLTDDSSIWSQNWPWTPVVAKGETFYETSACTLCPGGCGITVRMVDDRTIKIEGQTGHPVNDGGVCVLGLSGLQLLYSPNRVTQPMKRTGSRGSGRWEPISWDDAINEVVEKLSELRGNHQPQKVGCITGDRYGTIPELFKRLMTVYGSPNVMTIPSLQDSHQLTTKIMHGSDSMIGYDFENADFILSFGSGLIEGWGSPVRMFKANSGWKENGIEIIQVEPRLSNTAAKSDQWIAIKPGTEAALAMGIMHVMLSEGLYDNNFIEQYASGFSGWKALVMDDYTPEKVFAITGVPAPMIQKLAKKFAGASRPLAVCGRGQGDEPFALNETMAIHALNALVGNLNQPGGVWAVPTPDYIDWPDPALDGVSETGLAALRIDGAGAGKYALTSSLLNRLPDAESAYSLEALFISNANPYYAMTDARAFQKRMEKIPFVVSFSSYMDETAMHADLILPNHAYLESYQDVPVTAGMPRPLVGLSRPVVEPLFDTMHVGDVIIRIAQELGGSIAEAFPWESYETCLEETLGDKWETLNDEGFWVDEDFQAAAWEDAFTTESGKFEFGNASMDLSPGFNALAPEGDEASYPLILIPYDSMRMANDAVTNPPFVMKTVEDTVLKGNVGLVEVNPETAKSLGLSEGSVVHLKTPKGEAKVKVYLYHGVMPGVVAMPKGLGHRTKDRFTAGKGSNIKELMGPVEDQASGLDVAWGIRAKLTKA
jgi:menaquinone reductase, molybdopterin-binding-like subunit